MEYPTEDPVLKRFYTHVEKDPNSDCWVWTATVDRNGYGTFSYNGKGVSAHRFSYVAQKNNYEWLDKAIAVKHSCDTKRCIKVEHLSAGTFSENLQEAWDRGLRVKNSQKPYCNNGHKRSETNYIGVDGYARCRECDRESTQRRRAKEKERNNNV
jgi:hypothetical protein